MLALRRALGDTQNAPRFVATVPRRGYQFVAEVRQVAREPADDSGPAAERANDHDLPEVPQAVPASAFPARKLAVRATPQLIAAAVAIVAAVLLGGWYALQAARSSAPQAPAVVNGVTLRPSIAVLPFQNLSPLEEHAYFAAGMHEEVLSRLSRIRGLELKGRTSVLNYADGSTPFGAIVRDLGVAWVLEGSVRYAAERVRVTVRLVEGPTGTERWSETYDAALGDVFTVQGDIAARIAEELAATLTPAERSSLAAATTDSLEAYALYLQAIALYRTHGGVGVSVPAPVRETLIRHLDAALALDPEFAAALGSRAHLLLDALMFDSWAPADWQETRATLIQSIEADAARALELDAAQGDAHVTLARLDLYLARYDAARARLERARELRPSDPVVLNYLAMVANMLGDHSGAAHAARLALELDPKYPAPYTHVVIALRELGEYTGAVDAARRMIEAAPGAPLGYINLARTETRRGEGSRIVEPLRIAERLFDERTGNLRVDAALSYRRAGAYADAERLIREFEQAAAGRYVPPILAAMARLAVGDYAGAQMLLEQAIAARDDGADPMLCLLLRLNTWSDPVLEEPAWTALRARLGRSR